MRREGRGADKVTVAVAGGELGAIEPADDVSTSAVPSFLSPSQSPRIRVQDLLQAI